MLTQSKNKNTTKFNPCVCWVCPYNSRNSSPVKELLEIRTRQSTLQPRGETLILGGTHELHTVKAKYNCDTLLSKNFYIYKILNFMILFQLYYKVSIKYIPCTLYVNQGILFFNFDYDLQLKSNSHLKNQHCCKSISHNHQNQNNQGLKYFPLYLMNREYIKI